MTTLSTLLDDIRSYIHGGRNLALFQQYSDAVHTARASGKTADITAATKLGEQLRATLPQPALRTTYAAVQTALRPDA